MKLYSCYSHKMWLFIPSLFLNWKSLKLLPILPWQVCYGIANNNNTKTSVSYNLSKWEIYIKHTYIHMYNQRPEDNSFVSPNLSKASKIHQNISLHNQRAKTTHLCHTTCQKKFTSNISIHNQRPEDKSSMLSISSKSSYIHQTYSYTIGGQKTTRPCRPTCQSQVKYI